jgi:hypothetical protein
LVTFTTLKVFVFGFYYFIVIGVCYFAVLVYLEPGSPVNKTTAREFVQASMRRIQASKRRIQV